MRRILPAVLTISVCLLGCRVREAMDKAKIARDLSRSGSTTDLLKDASKDHYDAPKDGRLTDSQVQMYLKVRDHEKDIAKVARQQLKDRDAKIKQEGDKSISGTIDAFKGLGSVADLMTADIRAAKDLGYNTAEYQWVKGQILAASASVYTEKLQQAANASIDSAYTQMKKAYDEAKDEQTKKAYADMMASYDKSKQEMKSEQKVDPAIAYNRQLLSKYENALNALTTEMSKYEEKEGEAKKSMDDFSKNVDKAVQDAKKNQ